MVYFSKFSPIQKESYYNSRIKAESFKFQTLVLQSFSRTPPHNFHNNYPIEMTYPQKYKVDHFIHTV